jgi:membrane protein YdbS with pleckstrin-like domain
MFFLKKLHLAQAWLNRLYNDPMDPRVKFFNGLVILLIILSVSTIPANLIESLAFLKADLIFLERLIVSLFTIEYLVRIWAEPKSNQYIFSASGFIHLLSFLPFYLIQFCLITSPWLIYSAPLLRLLKLEQIFMSTRDKMAKNTKHKHGEFQTAENEEIKYIAQIHWFAHFLDLLIPLVLTMTGLMTFFFVPLEGLWSDIGFVISITLCLLGLVFFLRVWLQFYFNVMYITNQRVILQQHKLFGMKRNEIRYFSITNIKPNTSGILHWIFKSGDIEIETSALRSSLMFKEVENPHEVVKHINHYHQRALQENIIATLIK